MYIDISIIVKHLRYFYHDRIYLNILFIVYFLRRIFINRKFPRFENEFEKYKMILYCFRSNNNNILWNNDNFYDKEKKNF